MFYESFRNKISRWSIWHSFRVYQTYILICQNETPYTAWNHAQCALHPDVLVLLEAKFRLFGFYEACEFVIVICMFGLSLSIKFVKKLTMMICLLVWEGQINNDSRVEYCTCLITISKEKLKTKLSYVLDLTLKVSDICKIRNAILLCSDIKEIFETISPVLKWICV